MRRKATSSVFQLKPRNPIRNFEEAGPPPEFRRNRKSSLQLQKRTSRATTHVHRRLEGAKLPARLKVNSAAFTRLLVRSSALACGVLVAVGILRLAEKAPALHVYYSSAMLEDFSSAPIFDQSIRSADGLRPPRFLRSKTIVHDVRNGQTLGTIANDLGFGSAVGGKIYDALESLRKAEQQVPSAIRAGNRLVFSLTPDGAIKKIALDVTPGSYVSLTPSDEGFDGSLIERPRNIEKVTASGAVRSSFAEAATAAGVGYDLVDDLVDLLGGRIVFHKDFRRGDRFVLHFQKSMLEDGTAIATGPIEAAMIEVNGKRYSAVRYVGTDGKARYFDGDGELIGDTFLRYPLKFSRISSYFSHSRKHPVLGRHMPHHGVDFAAPVGTPVRAVADGTVTFAGRKGANGIMIKLQHGDRYRTAYLHLSKITSGVRKGARVSRGQVIGAVGATGRATGPHLDYRFYDRGKSVDPLKVKLPLADDLRKGTKIEPGYLKRILENLEIELAKLPQSA